MKVSCHSHIQERSEDATPHGGIARLLHDIAGDQAPLARIAAWHNTPRSVALLDPPNAPNPSVPDAFAPDVASGAGIGGLVRIDVVRRWRRGRSAKDSTCR